MSKDDSQKAARARNKTVMLTPDMANQMRAKITGGLGGAAGTEKLDDELLKNIRDNQASLSKKSRGNEVPSKESETPSPDYLAKKSDDKIKSSQGVIKPKKKGFTSIPKPSDNEPASDDDFLSLDALVEDVATEVVEEKFSEKPQVELESAEPAIEKLDLPVEELGNVDKDQGKIEESDLDDLLNNLSDEPEVVEELAKVEVKEELVEAKTEEPEAEESKKDILKGEEQMVGSNELINWEKETKIIGFLVDYDTDQNGQVAILRTGRVIVSSDKVDKGNCFVIKDDSVSPMHAIVLAKESGIIVLDQLSEFGTSIERSGGEKLELSGDKASLEHGDLLSFGEKKYKVCLVS